MFFIKGDSDSFTSAVSHDDLSYRPIKDELENDEEFFKITSGFTRNMSHCDGNYFDFVCVFTKN